MTEQEYRALELKYEKHLPYRNGYENGYADAEAKWASVIEKITTEIQKKIDENLDGEGTPNEYAYCYEGVLDIIDKAIKGEEK